MVFSSIPFLFYFLPVLFLIYMVSPASLKNSVLLLGSLVFYAWGEPVYLLLLLCSATVNFFLGQWIRERKGLFILSIILNVGLLVYFKYFGFLISLGSGFLPSFITKMPLPALPLGISFYTFQILSYLTDVYRGKTAPQKNWISFAMYVTLFPQLIAGPIVRYSQVESELSHRKPEYEKGVSLFIIGLSEKVLLANQIGLVWEETLSQSFSGLAAPGAWLSLTAYAFQIYFDFAGYSNMAIGLGLLFGFHFPKNFDKPYISKSMTEFWRRWHISLGSWFREYVYIPLGGNRKGLLRQLLNILLVWLLTGLWHGAHLNFVLWGLYFGILLLLEKLFLSDFLKKLPGFFQHCYAVFAILIGWALFAFPVLSSCLDFFRALFRIPAKPDSYFLYLWSNNRVLFLLCFLASIPLPKRKNTLFLLAAFLLSVAYLVNSSYNPFLYFRF